MLFRPVDMALPGVTECRLFAALVVLPLPLPLELALLLWLLSLLLKSDVPDMRGIMDFRPLVDLLLLARPWPLLLLLLLELSIGPAIETRRFVEIGPSVVLRVFTMMKVCRMKMKRR
jgi:hypothetical protein